MYIKNTGTFSERLDVWNKKVGNESKTVYLSTNKSSLV